jgi:hypothetical protein
VLRHRAEMAARIHVAPDRRAPAEAPQLVERFIGQEIVDNHELGPALAPPRRDLAAGCIVTDRSPRYPLPLIEVNLPSPRASKSDRCPPPPWDREQGSEKSAVRGDRPASVVVGAAAAVSQDGSRARPSLTSRTPGPAAFVADLAIAIFFLAIFFTSGSTSGMLAFTSDPRSIAECRLVDATSIAIEPPAPMGSQANKMGS